MKMKPIEGSPRSLIISRHLFPTSIKHLSPQTSNLAPPSCTRILNPFDSEDTLQFSLNRRLCGRCLTTKRSEAPLMDCQFRVSAEYLSSGSKLIRKSSFEKCLEEAELHQSQGTCDSYRTRAI
jgi:hypothetical protein